MHIITIKYSTIDIKTNLDETMKKLFCNYIFISKYTLIVI